MNIAIIPARGGSKRVPRKNIKNFLGKPIIAYSIEAALRSNAFDEVMVSTDDEEIAQIAKSYGACVPFFRSAEKSDDMTGVVPVLIEVLHEYEKLGKTYKHCAGIYPCAPFVTAERLKKAMSQLISSGADSVVPIVKFSYPPQRGLVVRGGRLSMLHPENYIARSQDLEPMYHDAGQFFCVNVTSLINQGQAFGNHCIPLELPETEVQDIDTEADWTIAELKYRIARSE